MPLIEALLKVVGDVVIGTAGELGTSHAAKFQRKKQDEGHVSDMLDFASVSVGSRISRTLLANLDFGVGGNRRDDVRFALHSLENDIDGRELHATISNAIAESDLDRSVAGDKLQYVADEIYVELLRALAGSDLASAKRAHELLSERRAQRSTDACQQQSERLLAQVEITAVLTKETSSKLTALEEALSSKAAGGELGRQTRALVLDGGVRPLPTHFLELGAVSRLLVAEHAVVPFGGRTAELADLDEWANSPERVSVRLVVGAAGAGKTRLVGHWLRSRKETAGFLNGEINDQCISTIETTPQLSIAIDYAEAQSRLELLLQAVAGIRKDEETPRRFRLILIARERGPWWQRLLDGNTDVSGLLMDGPIPVELAPLTPKLSERVEEFNRALRSFGDKLGRSIPKEQPDLSHDRFQRPLYVHMAALSVLLGVPVNRDAGALVYGLLNHEQHFWRRRASHAVAEPFRESFLEHALYAVAAVTLLGGIADGDRLNELLEVTAPDGPAAHWETPLRRLLCDMYPPSTGKGLVAPLQPDLIGEGLIAQVVGSPACRLRVVEDVLDKCTPTQLTRALQVLGRVETTDCGEVSLTRIRRCFEDLLESKVAERAVLACDAACALGELSVESKLGGILAEALFRASASEGLTDRLRRVALELREKVPLRTVSLRELDVWVTGTLAATESADPATHAMALLRHGESLAALVRSENGAERQPHGARALEITKQATSQYRALALINPEKYLPRLMDSLDALGSRMASLGYVGEAWRASRECVLIGDELARHECSTNDVQLPLAYSHFSERLAGLGKFRESLEAAEKAVGLQRVLVSCLGDADSQATLGKMQSNLGARYRDVGQLDMAVEETATAVETFRMLARRKPDKYLPELAAALRHYGDCAKARDGELAALISAEEETDLYRRLMCTRRYPFLADFHAALLRLAGLNSTLGRRQEESAAREEADGLLADLKRVQSHPQVLADRIIALNRLDDLFGSEVECGSGSVSTAAEAVQSVDSRMLAERIAFECAVADAVKRFGEIQWYKMMASDDWGQLGQDAVTVGYVRHRLSVPSEFDVTDLDVERLKRDLARDPELVNADVEKLKELEGRVRVEFEGRSFQVHEDGRINDALAALGSKYRLSNGMSGRHRDLIFAEATPIYVGSCDAFCLGREIARAPIASLSIAALHIGDSIIAREESYHYVYQKKWAAAFRDGGVSDLVEQRLSHLALTHGYGIKTDSDLKRARPLFVREAVEFAILQKVAQYNYDTALGPVEAGCRAGLIGWFRDSFMVALREPLGGWRWGDVSDGGPIQALARWHRAGQKDKARRLYLTYLADNCFSDFAGTLRLQGDIDLALGLSFLTGDLRIDMDRLEATVPVIHQRMLDEMAMVSKLLVQIAREATYDINGDAHDFAFVEKSALEFVQGKEIAPDTVMTDGERRRDVQTALWNNVQLLMQKFAPEAYDRAVQLLSQRESAFLREILEHLDADVAARFGDDIHGFVEWKLARIFPSEGSSSGTDAVAPVTAE